MALTILSVTEYAKIRGITPQGVRNALLRGDRTPGVIDARMLSGRYLLTVDTKKLKKYLVATTNPPTLAKNKQLCTK